MKLWFRTDQLTQAGHFYIPMEADEKPDDYRFSDVEPPADMPFAQWQGETSSYVDMSPKAAEQRQKQAEDAAAKAKQETAQAKAETEALRMTVAEALAGSDADTLAKLDDIYPAWVAGVTYTVDNIVQYGGKIYKCLQAGTSTDQTTPTAATYMWSEITKTVDGDNVWVKPTGYDNAYAKGTIVLYSDGKYYMSQYDGNDQDPGAGDTRYWVEVNKDGSAVTTGGTEAK